jgi:hypothetical protein
MLRDMAASSSRAITVLFPGEAEFRVLNSDHHEATACPQYEPLKYKAQAAVIALGRPGNGHNKA